MTYAVERMIDRAIEKATLEGMEKGMEKGKREGLIQIAKVLYKKGMDKDEIVDITDLTPEEIQNIVDSL